MNLRIHSKEELIEMTKDEDVEDWLRILTEMSVLLSDTTEEELPNLHTALRIHNSKLGKVLK